MVLFRRSGPKPLHLLLHRLRISVSSRCGGGISQQGQSLVEVVIAMLLTAIVVSSIFIVSLTAQRNITRSGRRVAANYAAQRLLETLKNYVTADNSAATAAMAPGRSWSLPGDTCGAGCAAGCYALDPGCVHTVTNFSASGGPPYSIRWIPIQPGTGNPPQGMDVLYGMTMSYTVTDESGTGAPATARPRVSVTVNWTEPQ